MLSGNWYVPRIASAAERREIEMAVIGDLWNGKTDGKPIGYLKVLPAPRPDLEEACSWVETARAIVDKLDGRQPTEAELRVVIDDAIDLAFLVLGTAKHQSMADLVARARVISGDTDGEYDRMHLTA